MEKFMPLCTNRPEPRNQLRELPQSYATIPQAAILSWLSPVGRCARTRPIYLRFCR